MTRFCPAAPPLSRRRFLAGTAMAGLSLSGLTGAVLVPRPAIARSGRPMISHGVQSGDVTANGAMVWSRADRPARLIVDAATTDSFQTFRRVLGPAALEATDFTAKLDLTGLPAGQDIFYRVWFQDLSDVNLMSEPVTGRFRTAPAGRRDITFVWTGDTCGQGWGINPEWGGMKGYEAMRALQPDFMIHSGDCIYADNPIEAEKQLPDGGGIWRNIVTEEKSKVAETLAEFRGNYKYNLMDENVLRFNAEVPVFYQWDDHETTNNWYPNEVLTDPRYQTVQSCALLAARANRAFHEYTPIRPNAGDPERIYRVIHYGPLLDIFMIDMRSYRADNGLNRQGALGPDTAFLGRSQVQWLKRELLASTATWKVIAADMPIGIVVPDGDNHFEAIANRDDGPALGRELEIADLLRFIKHNGIVNTVWLTADVHYTAAHYYDPNRAQFQDFNPFWEFVAGPIHAGSFGPGTMDATFGPQVMYQKSPEGRPNRPPSDGLQFFGQVRIDGTTEVMTVTLKDIANADLYAVDLTPEA